MQARVDSRRFGPWAHITGASSGIGREFARQIAASQINVVLIARRQTLLDALGTELSRDRFRTKPGELDSQIKLHCLSMLALRSQPERDSVPLTSPVSADSSASAEKSASFPVQLPAFALVTPLDNGPNRCIYNYP
jgi:NAD(P)-dependent dehydrogenase (short-subunit alcohol dehydrogenase family)